MATEEIRKRIIDKLEELVRELRTEKAPGEVMTYQDLDGCTYRFVLDGGKETVVQIESLNPSNSNSRISVRLRLAELKARRREIYRIKREIRLTTNEHYELERAVEEIDSQMADLEKRADQ